MTKERGDVFSNALQLHVVLLIPSENTVLTWHSSRGQRSGARGGDTSRRTHGRWRGPAYAWQVRRSVRREGRLGGVALLALTAGHP